MFNELLQQELWDLYTTCYSSIEHRDMRCRRSPGLGKCSNEPWLSHGYNHLLTSCQVKSKCVCVLFVLSYMTA